MFFQFGNNLRVIMPAVRTIRKLYKHLVITPSGAGVYDFHALVMVFSVNRAEDIRSPFLFVQEVAHANLMEMWSHRLELANCHVGMVVDRRVVSAETTRHIISDPAMRVQSSALGFEIAVRAGYWAA